MRIALTVAAALLAMLGMAGSAGGAVTRVHRDDHRRCRRPRRPRQRDMSREQRGRFRRSRIQVGEDAALTATGALSVGDGITVARGATLRVFGTQIAIGGNVRAQGAGSSCSPASRSSARAVPSAGT